MSLLLRFLPFLLMIGYAVVMWKFSARRLARDLDTKSRRLRDSRMEPCLARLAKALNVNDVPVHVYEVDAVNGLAAPDGRVFLTEGFMRLYRDGRVTPEELTSVIAHELGHVAHGHARRRMIDFAGQNVLRAALVPLLGRLIPFAGVWIANQAARAIAARLSRDDEFEADAFASALMMKAGLGTAPQISLFEKLETLSGPQRATLPAWLMTHPKTPDRIRAIRARTGDDNV